MAPSRVGRRMSKRGSITARKRKSEPPGQVTAKPWPFSKTRELQDRVFWSSREALRAKGDVVDIFMRDYSTTSVPYRRVRKFCDTWPLTLRPGMATTAQPIPARAWIDICSQPPHQVKKLPNRLTSGEMFSVLKKFTPSDSITSYRLMIHIQEIDPDFIRAIAKTAWYHQVDALRDAISQHLAAETSIKVRLPISGFPIFRLEFHQRLFTLKEKDDLVPFERPNNHHMSGISSDLAFLNLSPGRQFVIEMSHVTVVICGWDDSKYAVFSFDSRKSVEDHEEQDDESIEITDSDDEGVGNEIEHTLEEDIIASNSTQTYLVESTIKKPRLYWLIVVESKIRHATDEWTRLVDEIGERVEERTPHESLNLEWTTKATILLNELSSHLEDYLSAWGAFLEPGGGSEYFTSMRTQQAHLALDSIKECFGLLARCLQRLKTLYTSCQNAAMTTNLLISQESNRVNLESYELNQDAIALNRESCKLSREANAMNREGYKVALETNRVSLANNLNAAQMLSLTHVITTVVVVAGYFGTQEKVFSFSRDARSFLLCILVVHLMLIALSLLTFLVRKLQWYKGLIASIVLGQWDQLIETRKMHTDDDTISKAWPRPLAPSLKWRNIRKQVIHGAWYEPMRLEALAEEGDLKSYVASDQGVGSTRNMFGFDRDAINSATYNIDELVNTGESEPVEHEAFESHLFPERLNLGEMDWRDTQAELPEDWKWDVDYTVTHEIDGKEHACLTCMPTEPDRPQSFPLTISNLPVVLPVEYQWPPMAGVNPPPDPRPSAPIDCHAELSIEVIRDLFLTFESSIGFYLLVNGLLQIIVPEDFDREWASSHLPHEYSGLKVCYIRQDMEPTMFQEPYKTGTPNLQLNDFIEARAKSSSKKAEFAGRIGLKVKKDGDPYLIMSTHVITAAILAKPHMSGFFGRKDRLDKLDDDWNEHVEIWAGNEKVGTFDQTFDKEAGIYPNGFKHDVSLIKPTNSAAIKHIASRHLDLGWLSRQSWQSLRQCSASLKVLGPTEAHRASKTLRNSRHSEALIVGEGIFLNQNAAKPTHDHDISTWQDLISRAVLYRVCPDFDPPTGYSGVALYAEGMREDGTEGPGIVGFQSFVQRSGGVQNFEMEGVALDERLKKGRVAFYGAFMVPEKLKKEFQVV